MIRVWKSIKWQLQVVFYEIRTAAAFFIILNGLLLILPLSACRVIDKKAGLLVLLISICYAASLLLGLFYGMNHMLEKPDARQNELWRLAEPNPWLRIFSRLTAVAAVMAFSLFNGQAGTILMQKFADANHSYFRMQMKDDIPGAFLQFALLLPLLYLFLTLSSSRRQNCHGKALTLIAALFIGQMVSDALKSLPLIAGVPAGIALLFFLLWQSGKLEEGRDVP